MIVDDLENSGLYGGLGAAVRGALERLRGGDWSSLKPGRHDIEGTRVYVVAAEYTTAPREEKRWEAHRRYVDVQCMVRGTELVGYAPLSAMSLPDAYDEAGDAIQPRGEGSFILLRPGMFMILFPDDAHMPGVAVTRPEPVRKIVVKIAVTALSTGFPATDG